MNRKRHREIFEYYQDKFSVFLLKFSKNIPLNFPLLNSLRRESDFLLKFPDYENCNIPEDITINISDLVFFDIIFFEDFLNLKNSIRILNNLCGDRINRSNRIFNEWINELNEKPELLGDYNLGFFDFSKMREIKFLKLAQFNLLHISPSVAILSIQVEVNDKFKEEFQRIISTVSLPFIKINKINFRTGFIGWERKLGFYRRKSQINKLFNLANSEMIKIRKRYLDVGNYRDLNYPILKIFNLQNSLNILLKNEDERKYYRFFDSIGFNINHKYFNQNDKWFFLGKNERSNFPLNYIIITSEEDFKKTKDSSHSSLNITINFYANELSAILALNSYLITMRKKILLMRNYINPILLKNRSLFNRLKKGFRLLNDITSLDYKLERIAREIKNPQVAFQSFIDIDDLKYSYKDREYVLKDELISSFEYLIDDCKN